jgi:ankyrin repeat protein
MFQPEGLRTDDYLPWSRGRGNDVWRMIRAAADGDLATLNALLAHDSTLVDCEYQYYRPFYFAVRENQLDAVKLLLDRGADPFCGGLGFQCAYRPRSPGNLPWPPTLARERGFDALADLLDKTLWERFQITPDGEILPVHIRSRDVAQVQATLDARPELLHFADGFGNKPIHWATMTRQLEFIDLFLDRGADLEDARPDGCRPLDLTNGDYHYRGWRDLPRTAIRPHEVLIGYLLARGAYYDIWTAAQLGDLERVQTLVQGDPSLINATPASSDYYNGAPLRNAAKGGHLAVVKYLLELGADPNRPEGVAPHGGALYEAVAGKHWDVVKLLLEFGANVHGHVESSGTVFWRAKREEAPPEIIQLLASHGAAPTYEMAAYDEDLEAIALMLSMNPSLDVVDHLNVENEDFLRLVMKYQPDVLSKTSFSAAKNLEQARWLLERGVDAVSPNWLGATPLHRFAFAGKQDFAELCLERGANLNAIDDEYSSTPLGWAARAGKKEMVSWLLAQGADPTLPHDKPWAQPAAWANLFQHTDVAQLLPTP